MESKNVDAPFEVVFRGAEEEEETLKTSGNGFVSTTGTSTISELTRGSLSDDRLCDFRMQTLSTDGVLEEDSPLRETHSDPFKRPRCWRDASSLSMIIASMIVFCVGITIAMIIQILVGSPQVIPHAGVMSDDGECSKIGIKVLADSADSSSPIASTVDAAILTSLCLIVKNVHKGGLGGGGFMLIEKQHDAQHDMAQINFREISPANTDTSLNVPRDQVTSGSSVAIPGLVRGLKLAHDKFGKAPWKSIFKEAQKLASGGVKVSEELSSAINSLDLTSASDELKNLVTKEDNITLLTTNDTLKQPSLANTLQAIGANPDSFYKGGLAQNLVDTLAKQGSKMTLQDLKNYEADYNQDVLKVRYSKMSIAASGPPSSGPVVLSSLNYMSKYDINNNKTADYKTRHRLLEALKYSYGYQPSWETTQQVNSSLLGTLPIASIIDNKTFPIEHYLNGTQPIELNRGGEQHVTAIGYDGLVVTIVMGIGSPFGSKLMSSGYVLNNAMLDFSWPGKSREVTGMQISQANMIAGNKRPMSFMSSVMVLPVETKCGLYLGFDAHEAASGISALLQTILKKGSGSDLISSVNAARLNQDTYPFTVEAEGSVPSNVIRSLRSLGHNVTQISSDETIGVCNALSYLEGIISPYVDQRDEDDVAYVF